MRTNRLAAAFLILSLAAGCTRYGESVTIDSGPPKSAPAQALDNLPGNLRDLTVKDLKQTAENFDNALMVGKQVDNFVACAHLINQDLGIEPVPGAGPVTQAQMTNAGVFSQGSILVVQFLDAGAGGGLSITIPQDCLAAYGLLRAQFDLLVASKAPGGGQLVQVKQGPALTTAQRQTLIAGAMAAAQARAAAIAAPPPAPAPAPVTPTPQPSPAAPVAPTPLK